MGSCRGTWASAEPPGPLCFECSAQVADHSNTLFPVCYMFHTCQTKGQGTGNSSQAQSGRAGLVLQRNKVTGDVTQLNAQPDWHIPWEVAALSVASTIVCRQYNCLSPVQLSVASTAVCSQYN